MTSVSQRVNRLEALDGLRGLFLMLLVIGHLGLYRLAGAWILLTAFFFISGYLITTILLRQYQYSGSISIMKFYRGRARRLLPGLVLVVLAVVTWAVFFANADDRRLLKGDALATLGFVMNWRLISQGDDYFGNFDTASFFRHAWTLGVEEQYYIISPFLVLLLISLRSNRWRVALLGSAILASTAWAAHIGVATIADHARVYYGTDTRIAAILVGVGLAFVLAFGWRAPRWLITLGGPISVVIALAMTWLVDARSAFMFERGGLLFFTAVCAVGTIAVMDGRSRVLDWVFTLKPLVWCGVRIYGIYLWHWPIKLWLERYAPMWSTKTVILVGIILTLCVAWLSYKYLEEPVMRRGMRTTWGRVGMRTMTSISALTMIVLLTFGLPWSDRRDEAADFGSLVAGAERYEAGDTNLTVGVYGDSVATGLVADFPQHRFSDLHVLQLGGIGCGITTWTPAMLEVQHRAEYPPCVEAKSELETRVRDRGIDVVVMAGGHADSVSQWDENNVLHEPLSQTHIEAMYASLDDLHAKSLAGGAQAFVLVTVPCRDVTGAGFTPEERPKVLRYLAEHPDEQATMSDPRRLNVKLVEWADARDVPVLDLYTAMGCQNGFTPERNGHRLYKDEIHFSIPGAAMVWSWLAPEVRRIVIEGDS